MPEGDTLAKVARALRPMLCGERLLRAEVAQRRAPLLAGRVVLDVGVHGKHLMVRLGPPEDGWTLRVHLGMTGSWHRYAPGEAWRRPRRLAGVLLVVPAHEVVCFSPADVEAWPGHQRSESGALERLGPDLLAAAVDHAEVLRRARALPAASWLIDVLLDQRVAAGIGNVYKSELMFMAGQSPARRLGEVDDAVLAALYRDASLWLRRNLGDHRRTTTYDRRGGRPPRAPPRLWVYGRAGQACLRCQAPIRSGRLGRQRRSTFWCGHCQGQAAALPGSDAGGIPQEG